VRTGWEGASYVRSIFLCGQVFCIEHSSFLEKRDTAIDRGVPWRHRHDRGATRRHNPSATQGYVPLVRTDRQARTSRSSMRYCAHQIEATLETARRSSMEKSRRASRRIQEPQKITPRPLEFHKMT